MSKNILHIKNMVCPRCITAVQSVLAELHIAPLYVNLGEVGLQGSLDSVQRKQLEEQLIVQGFELLQDQKSSLISQIKAVVIRHIRDNNSQLKINFSDFLSEELHQDYGSLSRLFSSVEGITIEKFMLKQKIERVKELLFYNEMTLSQIANQMNYSSLAHLSNQFKKETGMTPTAFKNNKKPGHQALDTL